MLKNITIGRFRKTGLVTVCDRTDNPDGSSTMHIINSGTSPQDHVFADNVERTLRANGLALETVELDAQHKGELIRCIGTA